MEVDIKSIQSREQLPLVFSKLGYKIGAEIGVLRGRFSKVIMSSWDGTIILVDPWKFFESGYEDSCNVIQEQQSKNYRRTKKRLRLYRNKVVFMRETSLEASLKIKDNSLDWVFIDANHAYEYVKQDIEAWWPKVKSGGIFSGHDYKNGTTESGIYGVKKAVDEFFVNMGYDPPHTTIEKNPSWIVMKK